MDYKVIESSRARRAGVYRFSHTVYVLWEIMITKITVSSKDPRLYIVIIHCITLYIRVHTKLVVQVPKIDSKTFYEK